MNKIQECLILLLSLLPNSQAQDTKDPVAYPANDFGNFYKSYGLVKPDDNSCPTDAAVGDNWYIDQAYDSACFPRQVECRGTLQQDNTVVVSTTGATRECPAGYTFIPQNNENTLLTDKCYLVSGTDALNQCGVTVDCTLDGIRVHVSDGAVFGQDDALLQFGAHEGVDTPDACKIERVNENVEDSGYTGYLDFSTTDVSDCDVTRVMQADTAANGDGYYIQYNFVLKRYAHRTGDQRVQETDQDTGTVVTREKCFMANVQCNYNPDGVVTSRYQPSSPNALDEHDESNIDFEMERIACAADDGVTEGSTPFLNAVYVRDDVCFRTKITTKWHDGIRINTPKCWATPTAEDPNSEQLYNLFDKDNQLDSTVQSLCDSTLSIRDVYEEAFTFKAFRFQNTTGSNPAVLDEDKANDVASYGQTIHVHCEVNACELSGNARTEECHVDLFNDCFNSDGVRDDAPARRARRAAPATGGASMLPKLTRSRVISAAIVLPPRERMNYVSEEAKSYSLLSDTLSLGLFAVGSVFGVVALGMYVVMKRQMRQLKYSSLTNNQ